MDSDRFDALTRTLATRQQRRTMLRATLAAAAGFLLARFGQSADAQGKCAEGCAEGETCANGACVRPCANHRDCRSKHDDPCISNTCVDGTCVSAIVDCLPGYECCEGSCCAKRCDIDEECAVLDPCRWGSCGLEGVCVFTELDPCVICASDEECAATSPGMICCEGACQRPCPAGTVMGKGCECRASGSATLNGLVVRDDASGASGLPRDDEESGSPPR